MSEISFELAKIQLLKHIQNIFEEMEQEIILSHQEKYILLEDLCENASDVVELKVAFEQWYNEYVEEISFEYTVDELWDHSMSSESSYDMFDGKDELDDNEEEETDT